MRVARAAAAGRKYAGSASVGRSHETKKAKATATTRAEAEPLRDDTQKKQLQMRRLLCIDAEGVDFRRNGRLLDAEREVA